MKRIRFGLIGLLMLLCLATAANASVSVGVGVGINLPGVSIGVNLPIFPQLVPVPGYPVYYAPQMNTNYFFYDGMYWVYQDDNWYASSWYNGPWDFVEPVYVPLFVLRIPVAYYRDRPASFRGWQSNAPPRWNQRWGHEWEQKRNGWDRWDRNSVPARAPRPEYQRKYSGDRYPRAEQQRNLHNQQYRYQSRDATYQPKGGLRTPENEQKGRQEERQMKNPRQQSDAGKHEQQGARPQDQKQNRNNRQDEKHDEERGRDRRN